VIDARTLVVPALLLSALGALAALAPACAAPPIGTVEEEVDSADPPPPSPTTDGGVRAEGGPVGPGTDANAPSCPYTGPEIDVSIFPACGEAGGGRCMPTASVPENERAQLAACPAGFCVPEKFLKVQGNFVPKTCKSIADGEGRCMSTVVPQIADQKSSLPQDVCDANERCAPCFNPLDGKDTRACSATACDSPKTKGAAFPGCCKDSAGKNRGVCMPTTALPPEALANLEQKECESAALCAPADNFEPGYVPPKCTASSLLGKYDGVCISSCVKRDFFTQLGTAQGTCAAGSFCAPCKNPLTGGPSGAPGCAP
jgi:hypothetical protein